MYHSGGSQPRPQPQCCHLANYILKVDGIVVCVRSGLMCTHTLTLANALTKIKPQPDICYILKFSHDLPQMEPIPPHIHAPTVAHSGDKCVVESCKTTHQSVKLCDADLLRVHHAELSPGDQVQAELSVTQRFTRSSRWHTASYRHLVNILTARSPLWKAKHLNCAYTHKWHVNMRTSAVRSPVSVV